MTATSFFMVFIRGYTNWKERSCQQGVSWNLMITHPFIIFMHHFSCKNGTIFYKTLISLHEKVGLHAHGTHHNSHKYPIRRTHRHPNKSMNRGIYAEKHALKLA